MYQKVRVLVLELYEPRKSALLNPLLNLPVGRELGKSMPLWGKSALAWLSANKLLVPTSAVESPSMKMAGGVALVSRGAKMTNEMSRKRAEGRYIFAIRK